MKSCAALAIVALSTMVIAAPKPQALVGRVVSGGTLDGWTVEASHSWCVPSGEINPQCLMVQLRKKKTVIVALTRPMQHSPLGGIKTETIYRVFAVEPPKGAELATCRDIGGRAAVLGWLNRRSKTASIFTTDGRSLLRAVIKYSSEAPCEIGED